MSRACLGALGCEMEQSIDQLSTLSTSTISDTLDRLGIAGQCFGILPLDPSFRLCGRAFTMRALPAGADGGTLGDYIDDVPAQRVIAIDSAGRLDATVWGDIMTLAAVKLGIAAYIVPFMFVYSGTLLLRGELHEIFVAIPTALIGIWALAKSLQDRACPYAIRGVLFIAAIVLINPGLYTDLIGLALIAAVMLTKRFWMKGR